MMLLTLWATAFAVDVGQLPQDTDDSPPFWLAKDVVAQLLTTGSTCKVTKTSQRLPKGLKVVAELRDSGACGVFAGIEPVVRVGPEKLTYVVVQPEDLTTRPPTHATAKYEGNALRKAWLRKSSGRESVWPLDAPHASQFPSVGGEAVDVMSENPLIVRTQGGRILAAYDVEDRDPFQGKKPDIIQSRLRLVQGRDQRKTLAPWTPKAADLMKKSWQGKVVDFYWDSKWGVENTFSDAWFDPVGQLIEYCPDDWDKRGRYPEPCGAYYLDFTAFGAWWPRGRERVLAEVGPPRTVGGQKSANVKGHGQGSLEAISEGFGCLVPHGEALGSDCEPADAEVFCAFRQPRKQRHHAGGDRRRIRGADPRCLADRGFVVRDSTLEIPAHAYPQRLSLSCFARWSTSGSGLPCNPSSWTVTTS